MATYAAPGRVNLIGEHTDYTGGFVMPMAIEFATTATINLTDDRVLQLSSRNFDESVRYDLDNFPKKGRHHWSDYPAGVIGLLRKRGVPVPGLRLELAGNVPPNAGLSSSASVEVATAIAVLQATKVTLAPAEIATLCQSAENDFVGGACGIMDQFISVNGREGHALLLDCRSLEYDLLPLPESVSVVICNSMVKHEVAHGEYGDRRGEVEAGQAALAAVVPHAKQLRDATLADLEFAKDRMSPASFARCRHIITENARVLAAKDALLAGDIGRFGELLYAAHASFRDDFAASCSEVDVLVDLARSLPGCRGARITGGGFGGCTINLVDVAEVTSFKQALLANYEKKTGIRAECYVSQASDGAIARLG